MPLFMDIHTVDSDNFSVEDVVTAHMEDLSVQDHFGVKQVKYWVNVEDKTIFCLMKGPDKESCHAVHEQSHGQTACNIIQVNDNQFDLFMGEGTKDEGDLAHTLHGELDTGYRTLLSIQLVLLSKSSNFLIREISTLIKNHNGSIVAKPTQEIMASFLRASDSIFCATEIEVLLSGGTNNIEFRIATVTGKPVDVVGKDLFEKTKRRTTNLCLAGSNGCLLMDKDTHTLVQKEGKRGSSKNFIVINAESFRFLDRLFAVLDEHLANSDFKTEDLTALTGLSKSSLFRKVKSLTNLSPNKLIQDLRLRKAFLELLNGRSSVSEVAYDFGFNSPAYFTRLFKRRFGILPTDII